MREREREGRKEGKRERERERERREERGEERAFDEVNCVHLIVNWFVVGFSFRMRLRDR